MNERDILVQKDFAVKEALAKGLAEGEARGKAKGLAKGLVEGEMKGKRETAKNMLAENAPIDFICRVTGLSQEVIQSL